MKHLLKTLITAVSILLANAVFATTHSKFEIELIGSWQLGLNDNTKDIPVGLAYQRGMTATVLTFNKDMTLRQEAPCKNAKLIKQVGEIVLTGSWAFSDDGLLKTVLEFQQVKMPESRKISINKDQMILTSSEGKQQKFGRFTADVNLACE
jgi:hypothetical protein